MDLPPGTGDVAISVAQLVPNAEILVVTTPQLAAAEVAERAGAIATQTHQQVVGVVENMSWLELPDGNRMEIFGSGGGEAVSDALTKTLGARVPLLGQIPLDTRLREVRRRRRADRAGRARLPGRAGPGEDRRHAGRPSARPVRDVAGPHAGPPLAVHPLRGVPPASGVLQAHQRGNTPERVRGRPHTVGR